MPNRSKQKGDRLERFIAQTLTTAGYDAKRVPLSGAAEGFKGDVHVTVGAIRPSQLSAKAALGDSGSSTSG